MQYHQLVSARGVTVIMTAIVVRRLGVLGRNIIEVQERVVALGARTVHLTKSTNSKKSMKNVRSKLLVLWDPF